MKQKTITLLNQLNHAFYDGIAEDFSKTRQTSWSGWEKLVKVIEPNQVKSILDVGCGNGRFLKFWSKKIAIPQRYAGVDSNDVLLNEAKQISSKDSVRFYHADIVDESWEKQIGKHSFDLICLFGVYQHIPSYDARLKLLCSLRDKLKTNGYLVFSIWKFAREKQFQSKRIDPAVIENLNLADLESGDFFLGWKKSKLIRYCHYANFKEVVKIKKELKLGKGVEFSADGKSGRLNRYVCLRKIV